MACLDVLMNTMERRRAANNPPPVYKNEIQRYFSKGFRNTPLLAYYTYEKILFRSMERRRREREAEKARRRGTGGERHAEGGR
ncbi:MAG TPA: hypothetical protein PKI76_04435 [Oscillospiraceae bacterium]|nr:hypothetical protein [Oscillospiraceae bacterium]HNW04610.1 hypothetical protein [Oscillospiraceae bacterium]